MLVADLLCYMRRRGLRILIVAVIITLMALFSVRNVYSFLVMSQLLPDNAVFTMADYLIGIFSSAQLVMYFIIPVSFSVLVADLIRGDFDENTTQFLLLRRQSRSEYLMGKCKLIFVLAVLFTAAILMISFITASLYGVSLTGEHYHYLFLAADHNVLKVFSSVIPTFILGVTFVGIMTLAISIYAKSAGAAVGVVVLIGFAHNIFFVIGVNAVLAWLPFSPYVLAHYNYFAPFGLDVSYFNGIFASAYMILGGAVCMGMIQYKLKKMEI